MPAFVRLKLRNEIQKRFIFHSQSSIFFFSLLMEKNVGKILPQSINVCDCVIPVKNISQYFLRIYKLDPIKSNWIQSCQYLSKYYSFFLFPRLSFGKRLKVLKRFSHKRPWMETFFHLCEFSQIEMRTRFYGCLSLTCHCFVFQRAAC